MTNPWINNSTDDSTFVLTPPKRPESGFGTKPEPELSEASQQRVEQQVAQLQTGQPTIVPPQPLFSVQLVGPEPAVAVAEPEPFVAPEPEPVVAEPEPEPVAEVPVEKPGFLDIAGVIVFGTALLVLKHTATLLITLLTYVDKDVEAKYITAK